jgi:hypothetical protein
MEKCPAKFLGGYTTQRVGLVATLFGIWRLRLHHNSAEAGGYTQYTIHNS